MIKKFKTLNNLKLSLQIPRKFKLVDDTGDFLCTRQHLSGGVAVGDGTSNLLIYAVPFKSKISMINFRDSIAFSPKRS